MNKNQGTKLKVSLVCRTAGHRAAEGEHATLLRFLHASGMDLNARDDFGWTPLYHSLVFSHKDTVQVLQKTHLVGSLILT